MPTFREVKKKIETLRKEKAMAEGAIQQLLSQLEEEFGVQSEKEAEAKLKELRRQASEAESVFEEKWAAFLEKWNTVLEEV